MRPRYGNAVRDHAAARPLPRGAAGLPSYQRWTTVGFDLAALREDCTHAWDDDCGRPRDVRTRPADLAAWADAAQGAACLQDLRYACPRQVERHCLSDLLRRTPHRYRMADWAATRARSRALLHCDPESVRQWALDLTEQSCRAFWARPHPSHH